MRARPVWRGSLPCPSGADSSRQSRGERQSPLQQERVGRGGWERKRAAPVTQLQLRRWSGRQEAGHKQPAREEVLGHRPGWPGRLAAAAPGAETFAGWGGTGAEAPSLQGPQQLRESPRQEPPPSQSSSSF